MERRILARFLVGKKELEVTKAAPSPLVTFKHLDYIVTSLSTGKNLERIADAVLKRIEEERQITRLASEIIRRGVEAEDIKGAAAKKTGKKKKEGS